MELITNSDDPVLSKLQLACSDIKTLLHNSTSLEKCLEKMDENFDAIQENVTVASRRVAPLQSLSIGAKALETRINRAISPALALLDSFKHSESLQRRLLDIASKLLNEKTLKDRLKMLIKYVDCVDELNISLTSISQESEPAIQKLQEVVEYLSRTKATDQYRTHRLRETLITLKVLYETEVDSMRFDGLLDEALLNLQDEYENLLQQLRHQNMGDDMNEMVPEKLGTELELKVVRRISGTLAANDCLDICIDIFVKVRYRRAAKALMRLSPDYLKTCTPEEIDEMEWVSLETAIALWIQHFELAVKVVFVTEKDLCNQVLGNIMEGMVWPECFVKIADKIMAVFFRFGEGVARSDKEPQKLFKLLDMFDSLEKLKPEFSEIFEGEAGADICSRFRELKKLLVHSSTKVLWEFGLQIESNQDGLPPPHDGSVPKLVRYAINYLKNLAVDSYSAPMAQVLRTDQLWKAGILLTPETDEILLKDAISNVMEAIQRNIETKKSLYKDKVLPHIFAMNTYWYIYMRTRNTELGKLLGEQYMKKRYRHVAEESAYLYQKQAWGTLVRLLDTEEIKRANKDGIGVLIRGKMDAFMDGFDKMCQRHRSTYSIISDADLREQMKEATVTLVLPAYTEFLNNYSSFLEFKSNMSPELLNDLLNQIFEGVDQVADGKSNLHRWSSSDLKHSRRSLIDQTHESKDIP
ncbi:exocyst complex component EXO70A1-like [Olea europaea subsp. europaea]|uniref:Exocyst subunit Exo70 family protein n=1 Tax=Olea europaea subsp. europaea TaxID=158383 RepID=A0A8S0SJZ7_OLEEU|nr:exocyst complex component EXO70A1-like [Olea europaea subsp. europaea]